MAPALRVALEHALEITEIFRDAVGDKIGGAAARFLPLVLVIEGRSDGVMRIVRFIDDIGDRQLQLMRPQPSHLVARRESVTPPEIKEDVRRLPDQRLAIPKERRRKGRMSRTGSVDQPLHRRDAAAAARDIDVFSAGLLQGETHEFAAPLNARPVIELIWHGATAVGQPGATFTRLSSASTHRASCAAERAPAVRATSRPCNASTSVGMLRT